MYHPSKDLQQPMVLASPTSAQHPAALPRPLPPVVQSAEHGFPLAAGLQHQLVRPPALGGIVLQPMPISGDLVFQRVVQPQDVQRPMQPQQIAQLYHGTQPLPLQTFSAAQLRQAMAAQQQQLGQPWMQPNYQVVGSGVAVPVQPAATLPTLLPPMQHGIKPDTLTAISQHIGRVPWQLPAQSTVLPQQKQQQILVNGQMQVPHSQMSLNTTGSMHHVAPQYMQQSMPSHQYQAVQQQLGGYQFTQRDDFNFYMLAQQPQAGNLAPAAVPQECALLFQQGLHHAALVGHNPNTA
jgi:hypothetical protein